MVLKKIFFLLFIFTFSYAFSQEPNYSEDWIKLFSETFINTPKVIELRNNINNSKINYGLQNRMWLPKLSVDIPAGIVAKRGDSIYIKNQQSSSQMANIFVSSPKLTLIQKLPGKGETQIQIGYGFQCLKDRSLFLQNPYLAFSFYQPLSMQMLNFFHDGEHNLYKKRSQYDLLLYYKNMYEQVLSLLKVLENYDKQLAEKQYYLALVAVTEERFKLISEKMNNGRETRLQKYYCEQELLNAKHQLTLVNYALLQTEKEILLLLPKDINIHEFVANLNSIRKGLLELLNIKVESNNSKNLNQAIYENLILQNKYEYKNDKLKNAPIFYAQASVTPDKNLNYEFTDWYKSWRSLVSLPYPIEISFSIGLKMELDFTGQNIVRWKTYQLNKENISTTLKMEKEKQEKEKKILIKELSELEKYWDEMSFLITEEQKYRKEKIFLKDENLITKEEFLQSELLYRQMFMTNTDIFWQIINRKTSLFYMTDSVVELIDKIDNYLVKK